MGGFIGGGAKSPPPPDTSYLERQEKRAQEERDRAERENKARRKAIRGGRGRSLLLFDTEAGVQRPETFG